MQISVWGSSFVDRRIRRRNVHRIGRQFSSVREDHIAQMEFSYEDDRFNFFRDMGYVYGTWSCKSGGPRNRMRNLCNVLIKATPHEDSRAKSCFNTYLGDVLTQIPHRSDFINSVYHYYSHQTHFRRKVLLQIGVVVAEIQLWL